MLRKNLSDFNVSKIPDNLLIIFGFFLPISPSFSSIIFAILFLTFLFKKNKLIDIKRVCRAKVSRSILLFTIYLIISSFWFKFNYGIIDLNSSYTYELNKTLMLFLCPVLFLFNYKEKTKRRAKKAFILGLIITVLLGLYNYFFFDLNFLFKSGHYNNEFYLQGFIDHSDLSIFFCIGIFILLNEVLKQNSKNYFLWLIIIAFVIFLLNSYGRTGIVCFLFLLPIFIILKYTWSKKLFLSTFIFTSVILLSFSLSNPLSARLSNTLTEITDLLYGVSLEKKIYKHAEYMSKNNPSQKSIEYWKKRILNDQNEKGEFIWLNHIKTTNNQNQTSIGKRVSIWKKYLNEIKSHKYFGKGLGSVSYLQKKKTISLNPHNYYIFILTEGGIIGLILLLNIFINMFNEYINDKKRVLKIVFPLLYILALFINDYLFIYNTIALFGFFSFILYSDNSS